MVWPRQIWLRLQTLFHRGRSTQRLDDEIQFHLEQQIAENVASGMSPQEARSAAMRAFGNPTFLKEQTRGTWGWIWLEQIGQDFRYGIRMLSRNTGFSLVAVLSLALGIGVNTTVFSAVNTVLLRPLAYPDADRLVLVQYRSLHAGSGRFELTPAAYLELRRTNKSFEGIAAFSASDFNLIGTGEPERLSGQMISPSLFSVLKVSSQIGRGFTAEDEKDGAPRVAILSYGLWQRRYGGQESVIGQTITLDDESFEVVGVAPRGFDFPEKGTDIWVPKVFAASELRDMNSYYWRVIERLTLGGGTFGLFLAALGIRILKLMNPGTIRRLDEVSIDSSVLAFTLGISCLAGFASGLAPALKLARSDVQQTLKEAGRSSIGSGGRRLLGVFVVAEIALSLALMVGAGLLIRSFLRLQDVSLGFTPDRLLTLQVNLPKDEAQDSPRVANLFREVIERVQALPGVQVAGVGRALPVMELGLRSSLSIEGQTDPPHGQPPKLANNRVVSPGYFGSLRIPLVEGRLLSSQDTIQGLPVAVINRAKIGRASCRERV